ncbi:MAG: M1 family metallopeptidase [Balneolaceae bacterium]|nr:M1 family metallopeptidase [Balneolaceae bacterium]
MKKQIIIFLFSLFMADAALAQMFENHPEFTRQDTLRGTITEERAWWDLTYYHLDIAVDIENRSISGSNTIQYKVLEPYQVMQVDLQEPMEITRVTQNGAELEVEQEGNAWFVTLEEKQAPGEVNEVVVEYSGKPVVAARPPWDGGITWQRDKNGRPFVASANQGIGASVWWPNKDHMYDEVDSMLISVNVPDSLMDVSNGRLRGVDDEGDGTKTWHWYVDNPINNYGVNINIGDYVHFKEIYEGEKGELDMDYYVLSYNKEKAIKQFADAPRTMKALEHWFGPYPFYEDGYKLVEAPYLGMEHQSSVTYGNGYENGYLGRDLSGSGWGLKFDFIIVHESGHEWFANNITYKDVADMWIHEAFTNYSENLFLNYFYGEKAANEYVQGLRLSIFNDRPIIGIYDVNYEGSSDMYYKGSNMLHTIRQIADDDSLWRATLRGLNKEFYHQTVTTEQIENYISESLGRDLDPVFDQYLRDVRIPALEYAFRDGGMIYRWANAIESFNMPVKITLGNKEKWLEPTTSWQQVPAPAGSQTLSVDPNFYVGTMNLLGY